MKQTLYDILEVSRDASFEDIEVAYAKRFEVLRAETSWDSNRLVMLNEAREVLSDAARRAAYDASLDTPPAPAGLRNQTVEDDEKSGSSLKWVIAVAILAAVVIWWAMRDDGPPVESEDIQVSAEEGQLQSDSGEGSVVVLEEDDISDLAVQDTISENEPVTPPPASATEAAPAAGTSSAAGTSAGAEAANATSTTAPTTAGTSIVGFWDCFEPVTGRTSEYGFGADGTLTIQPASGDSQSFSYEMAGSRINLVDTDPPQTINVEELASRKMILNSSGAGERIVCSR